MKILVCFLLHAVIAFADPMGKYFQTKIYVFKRMWELRYFTSLSASWNSPKLKSIE